MTQPIEYTHKLVITILNGFKKDKIPLGETVCTIIISKVTGNIAVSILFNIKFI
jgi:hypothetical protein